MPSPRQQRLSGPQGRGLASSGRAFDDQQLPVAAKGADHLGLRRVDPDEAAAGDPNASSRPVGAPCHPLDDLGLDLQHLWRRVRADMFGHIRSQK
jgi:hypothetical protein